MDASNFRTSINIKFDIGKEEFLDRYLPTPSHAESLVGLASGFTDKGANTAHIMIGPYGSGKSLVASMIGGIVSKSVEDSAVDRLTQKFEKVDQHIYAKMSKLNNLDRVYLPVILSGYEGSFSEAIINAINRELKKQNIDIRLSSDKETIIDILNQWENSYERTYDKFVEFLKTEKSIDKDQWLKQLDVELEPELEWFKAIYPKLTSGASYQSDNSKLFAEKMAMLLDALDEMNIGMFVIYDEFGRVLQTLENEDIYKTMQDLQDLAELASRSKGLLHFLLVSHKSMGQYMQGFNDEYKSEFQRIEKRFTTYFVESDTAAYYRIAEQYTSKINKPSLFQMATFAEIVAEIRKYKLFDELNQQELEKIVVEGAYPIHPTALFLLPRVSKVFGQNERTLFTFLESKESGGLMNFIEKNDGYYYAHNLFEFFFSKQIEGNFDDEAFNSLRLYKKIANKLGSSAKQRKMRQIVQFITLWELSNSYSVHKLDYDFISFSAGIEKGEVLKLLNEAEKNKFIRFNRVLDTWELYEGSPVIVNELIESQRHPLKINEDKRLAFLETLLKKPNFLATEYNDRKSMTRFMKVQFILSSQLLKQSIDFENLPIENSDGIIFFVLLNRMEEFKDVQEYVKKVKNERIIFSLIKNEYAAISSIIDKEIVVDSILNNKKLISEHALLFDELVVIQEELLHQISELLNQYTSFSKSNVWIAKGSSKRFKNEIALEDYISEVMYAIYGKTPLILNESINRMYVNSMQNKALHRVLDGVITTPNEENLGITGQGPDYLVFATVLKNNSIDLSRLDEIGDGFLLEIRQLLLEKLKAATEGRLSDLLKVFTNPPFGVRKPLIPLLFITLLRDKWNQFMFYRNEMFVSAVDADKVYKMFDEASEYTYKFHHHSDELVSFMEELKYSVEKYISESVEDQTLLIKTCSGLLNWLRSLPRVAQITKHVSPDEEKLRELIRRTEINPLDSMQQIYDAFGGEASKVKNAMESLNHLYERYYTTAASLLHEELGVKSYEDKESYLFAVRESAADFTSNRLLSSLQESSTTDEFLYNYIGINIENWSDTTFDLYEKQLKSDVKAAESNDLEAESDEHVIKLQYNNKSRRVEPTELSTKSQIVFNNVDRLMKNAGRNVPSNELNYILFKLLDKYME